jgi:hypothetical protein
MGLKKLWYVRVGVKWSYIIAPTAVKAVERAAAKAKNPTDIDVKLQGTVEVDE